MSNKNSFESLILIAEVILIGNMIWLKSINDNPSAVGSGLILFLPGLILAFVALFGAANFIMLLKKKNASQTRLSLAGLSLLLPLVTLFLIQN